MKVTHLNLTNVRVIESAAIHFRPGFNLVVGVNGVGKTTVIEALAISLSEIVKRMNKLRMRTKPFDADDIRIGADSMDVECGFQIGKMQDSYRIHKARESSVPQREAGNPREQVYATPDKTGFVGDSPKAPHMTKQLIIKDGLSINDGLSIEIGGSLSPQYDRTNPVVEGEQIGKPFAILFSTNRAIPSERRPSKKSTAGDLTTALADAFSHRELRLAEFADWMRAQQALGKEHPSKKCILELLSDTVTLFLPDYKHLRLGGQDDRTLLIDRNAATLSVRQLSDGERGLLALVLDLTRRLSQANPELENPATDAEAVVLIDEIDLHLHPKWQRQIVCNLTEAFPKCQFIATTHSPQIIGEVESDRIHIIGDGQVYPPTHSFGVDSSRVLEEIMETNPRTQDVHKLLARISHEIDEDRFEQARCSLSSLIEVLGENDPEVVRLNTLLDFMEENK